MENQDQQKNEKIEVSLETKSKTRWVALGLTTSLLVLVIAVLIIGALWLGSDSTGNNQDQATLTEEEKLELLNSLSRSGVSIEEKKESLEVLKKNTSLTPQEKLQLLGNLNRN